MHFIEILKLILQLFPLIIEAIKAVEAAIPSNGKGQEKLELIKGIVQTSYESSNKLVGSFEQLWPALSGVIKSIVTAFNATGIFKKD
jgi:hypothetical protein